jgi:hypothetical protein
VNEQFSADRLQFFIKSIRTPELSLHASPLRLSLAFANGHLANPREEVRLLTGETYF